MPAKRARAPVAPAAHPDDNEEEQYGFARDGELDLRDCELANLNAPMWVTPTGHVYLESFSPVYKQASDFLVAIAEPVCRPQFVHEYKITDSSLCTAASIGLGTDDIISKLRQLSKLEVHPDVLDLIRAATGKYGKVKLVLQRQRYFLDCARSRDKLPTLLKDDVIRRALVRRDAEEGRAEAGAGFGELGAGSGADMLLIEDLEQLTGADALVAEEDLADVDTSIEVHYDQISGVKKRCLELGMPVLEEYAHRSDPDTPTLAMGLRGTERLRNYQEKALQRMFGNGRARSGIIVLPCGSGKTLVGIAAANTVKKPCLVLCTSAVSVQQWRKEFLRWTDLDPKRVAVFTAGTKDLWINDPRARPSGAAGAAQPAARLHITTQPGALEHAASLPSEQLHLWEDGEEPSGGRVREGGILVTTFHMIGFRGARGKESEAVMRAISSRDWGLLLLDEVHVAPAATFRRVVEVVKAHAKLGLTATLVREDEKIDDLNYLIGPKLYEANWLDLQKAGAIATVKCQDVWCPMSAEFYAEYLRQPSQAKRLLLYALNPNKLRNCEILMRSHEARGDKIIIFSDNILALTTYARRFNRLMIHGKTPERERQEVLSRFREDHSVRTIFLSAVGDTSIDIPEANVIIQVNSHFGARRQEAQRLGRILRAKKGAVPGVVNAWFYTLISRDTAEMYYSAKRQQFLIDQGYDFEVIDKLDARADDALLRNLSLESKAEQLELLRTVLCATDDDGQIEDAADDEDARAIGLLGGVRRTMRMATALSGGDADFYRESARGGGGSGAGGGGTRGAQAKASQSTRHRIIAQHVRKKQADARAARNVAGGGQ